MGTIRRVYEVGTPGGRFQWRTLEDAMWHVDMMERWAKKIKRKERVTLRSYTTTKE